MRVYYPGVATIPAVLLLLAAIALLNQFGVVEFARVWSFWPVTLIATGVEEVYLWAMKKEMR